MAAFEPPPAGAPLELKDAVRAEARQALAGRLIELVTWPESRIPPHERQLAADILLGLLRNAPLDLRQRCANGLQRITDAPKALLRYLARDEIAVAEPLLEGGLGFEDSDLIAVVRGAARRHWLAIARRRGLSDTVTDALVQAGDLEVIEAVLRNNTARLSVTGVDLIVTRARQHPHLAALITARQELRPAQALLLFWWADHAARLAILRRFAVDRSVLIAELGETFALAARESWADAETRKALQVIERRQRNRAAAAQSPYGSIEGLIDRCETAFQPTLVHEIAHLGGVKPATAAQIFSDPGGEPIAVFAKSVGLRRPYLLKLWRMLQRPMGEQDRPDNPLGRTLLVYDTLATAKAQTVLRYWNWSFTADSVVLQDDDFVDDGEVSAVLRNAAARIRRNA